MIILIFVFFFVTLQSIFTVNIKIKAQNYEIIRS